jgi:hypothetical protein
MSVVNVRGYNVRHANVLWARVSGAGPCSLFFNFRFWEEQNVEREPAHAGGGVSAEM